MDGYDKDLVAEIAQNSTLVKCGRWLKIWDQEARKISPVLHWFNAPGFSLCKKAYITGFPDRAVDIPDDYGKNCRMCQNIKRHRIGRKLLT